MRKAILIVLLAVLNSYGAEAEELAIAGLTLGAPLSLPECEFQSGGSAFVSRTCFVNSWQLRPNWQLRNVALASKSAPSIFKGWIDAFMLDGTLVAVRFSTFGWETQQRDFETLIEKYGKPTSRKKEQFQNGFGAKFEGVVASWKIGKLLVEFNGIFSDRETGRVTISLPEGVALIHADAERIHRELNPNKL